MGPLGQTADVSARIDPQSAAKLPYPRTAIQTPMKRQAVPPVDPAPTDVSAPNPTHGAREPGFEERLAELEALVDTLERGDLTLEQSLAAFERGVVLTRTCQKALDAAEQKVRILTGSAEGAEPEPFSDE
jgi:exodeoxyribonuclease VII small subunit